MAKPDILFLHEEIMLLALRDEEGTIAPGTMYQYAISGAVLAELLLHERIGIDGSKKNKLVNLLRAAPLGDPLLDECLDRIRCAKRRASLQTWVSRFAGIKNLKHRVARRLCQRGILRVDEDKVLLLFTRKIYPEVNPKPEQELIKRLREVIITDTPTVDTRTVVLVSLAHSANLLKVTFDKKQLKGRKERIKHIISGEMTGQAATEAIAAMQAAVLAAITIPTLVTTTGS